MVSSQPRRRIGRRVLIAALVVVALFVAGVAVVVVPILTHRSAGGSGQEIPSGFVSETRATGADGRTRELRVETVDGEPADLSRLRPGDEIVVRGSGFDAEIGIYVAVCAIPDEPGARPSPCLGGIPDDATDDGGAGQAGEGADRPAQSSVWITDNWAWRNFATHGFEDAERGMFTARLLVADPQQENLDCRVTACAITTRADHTASADRVQDMQLPVAFAD